MYYLLYFSCNIVKLQLVCKLVCTAYPRLPPLKKVCGDKKNKPIKIYRLCNFKPTGKFSVKYNSLSS